MGNSVRPRLFGLGLSTSGIGLIARRSWSCLSRSVPLITFPAFNCFATAVPLLLYCFDTVENPFEMPSRPFLLHLLSRLTLASCYLVSMTLQRRGATIPSGPKFVLYSASAVSNDVLPPLKELEGFNVLYVSLARALRFLSVTNTHTRQDTRLPAMRRRA